MRLDPLGIVVERRDLVAGLHQLRGLAAGRGAEIEHGGARREAEQPGRDGGGGILHPPAALGIARQRLDRPVALEDADGVGEDRRGAERLDQRRIVVLERQVERRALEQGLRRSSAGAASP